MLPSRKDCLIGPFLTCFVHNHNPHEIEYDLMVATTVPSVRAVITLLPNLEHPRWPNRGRYMPHIRRCRRSRAAGGEDLWQHDH